MNILSEENREDTLDKLEASLNKIFLNVGSVFNGGVPLESERLAITKSRVHGAIPSAVNDLNNALDILEGDLMQTKTILTRDLLSFRAQGTENGDIPEPSTGMDVDDNWQKHNTTDPALPQSDPTDARTNLELSSSPDITIIDTPQAASVPPQATGEQSKPQAPTEAVTTRETQPASSSTLMGGASPAEPISDSAQSGKPSSIKSADLGAPLGKAHNEPKPMKASSQGVEASSLQRQANDTTEDIMVEDPTKDEAAEPSPGVSSLLPGLDMYANDQSGDGIGGIDSFNDMNAANDFDMANTADAVDDPFNTGDDMNQFSGEFNVDDLISFDANNVSAETGQNNTTQGGLDAFDDDFFNM